VIIKDISCLQHNGFNDNNLPVIVVVENNNQGILLGEV